MDVIDLDRLYFIICFYKMSSEKLTFVMQCLNDIE